MSGHPNDHYVAIADLTRSGAMSHREIAAAYGVSLTTVAKWVRTCRQRGLLPEAVRGRPPWSHPCPHCGAHMSARKDIKTP